MTSPVKIKIECEDTLLASAIASAITDGLRRSDFDNVLVKTVMVYSEAYMRNDPPPRDTFDKVNVIRSVITPDVLREPQPVLRAPMFMTELVPPYAALGHPLLVDTLRQRKPELLKSPVVVDMGIEARPYEQYLNKFLSGEVVADNTPPYPMEDYIKGESGEQG